MKDMIEWLIRAEDRTFSVYNKAADYVNADQEFSGFVRQLAYYEKIHHNIIMEAYDMIKCRSDLPSLIAVMSDNTKKDFDDCLSKIEKGIDDGTLTKDDLTDCIISLEFCEWNDAFAYVVTALKNSYAEFRTAAINIHRHKMFIKRFLDSHKDSRKHVDRITNLHKIWEEKILIVDDEQVIVDVMEAILSTEGMIEKAANGSEALEKLREKYYAAIISDVNMPVMDGVDFYKRAVELYPSINKRFLFFTGRLDEKQVEFFEINNLQYIQKPSNLKDIRSKVVEILSTS